MSAEGPAQLTPNVCACGSGSGFKACCQPFLTGLAKPATAEQLMRSRYTAYTLADGEYLSRTQHPDYRSDDNPEKIGKHARQTVWKRLQVIATHQGGPNDNYGEVEFKAWYEQAGQLVALHERSRFVRIDDQWLYTNGDLPATTPTPIHAKTKVGRNSPCPCGSGKKYKKCCGA